MVRNTPEVKQLNKERIRREIQRGEKCTKAGISKKTALSVATCSTILNEMQESGEILQADQEESNVGRPASQFMYNPDFQHVLAMYVSNEQGVNTVELATADALGAEIRREQVHPETISYELIESLVADAVERDGLLQGMTFGIPGVSHHGVIETCDVESIIGVNVEGRLNERFGLEVNVRNDMDFVSNGVYHTVPNSGGTLATMYFPKTDTGCVGCGFVIGGKVLRGFSKFAGEISYAAEGFGLSRQEQIRIILDRENRSAFRELAAKMVLLVVGTIDPEIIMLMGNEIDEEDLAVIRDACRRVVSEQHIPKLLVDNNISKHYMNGLIRVALDQLQFRISQ